MLEGTGARRTSRAGAKWAVQMRVKPGLHGGMQGALVSGCSPGSLTREVWTEVWVPSPPGGGGLPAKPLSPCMLKGGASMEAR